MNKKLKLFPLLLLLSSMVIGCGPVNDTTDNPSSDNTTQLAPWVDYVKNGSVKLTHDYKDRDFYKDGIGQVTLRTAIDGDTAHFVPMNKTTSGENIKARFFGIDTPESTGKVQPYGKAASNFTKEKLMEADKNGTIVVSSPFEEYKLPEPDSTGERYVSLVWVNLEKKNAPMEELYLLNLWIVQEGLSWVKNVLAMPQYSDTFYAASAQAEAYKKNLFSGEEDPDFPKGDYEVASLLDLKKDNVNYLTQEGYESKYNNKRVAVMGTVAGFSNHILYLQDYFDEEESGTPGGEYAGINVFTGMSPIPSKYTTINTYIQLFGLVQVTDNFGFQITDVDGRFPSAVSFDDNDCKIITKPQDNVGEHALHVFEYTANELSSAVVNNDYAALNCSVKVTEPVKVTRTFVKSSNEITLTLGNLKFGCYITFSYCGDLDKPNKVWDKESDFNGQSFYFKGIFTYHKTMSGKIMFQINPNNSADVVWVK